VQGQKEYHFAIVTRNDGDKLKAKARGSVFFKSDTLTNGTEWPEPAQPSFPLAGQKGEGFFWVPQVGDQIEIEIDKASEHQVPKYIRGIYSSVDEVPKEFSENYPFRMGWRTRAGHILLFDNKEDALMVKFLHVIGTGFEWNKDGDEIKTIIRDLKETIKRDVSRSIGGKTAETYGAEVTRTYAKKVAETYKNDLFMEIMGALTMKVKGAGKLEALGALDLLSKAALKVAGTGGTTVGSGASVTDILGSLVNLGGGGAPVAKVGSQCIGTGNVGAPVVSMIVDGSATVTTA